MKIVITGSLGNISKPLTQLLVDKGHEVVVITRKPEKLQPIELLGAKAAIGDVDDIPFLSETFKGADWVYCMLPPFDYFDPNLDVMERASQIANNYKSAILQSGVKKIIHLSSIGAHLEKGNGLLRFHYLAEKILKELPEEVSIIHMRPTGFYNNLLDFMSMVKGEGFLGRFLTFRYAGLFQMIQGKTGLIAANYGGNDKTVWVSPLDIAEAIAEEIQESFQGRKFRYIASEELTCQEIAQILGEAIHKPYLKWYLMSDKDMLGGLKMFGINESRAKGIVEMNAGIHSGLVDEDYYKNRPSKMGKVKMKDFAKEFAVAFNK